MNKHNESSWFPIAMFLKTKADKLEFKDVLFGPAKQVEHVSYPYPKEVIRRDETVVWNPKLHKTVSLKSYERAHQMQDIDALGKISKAGIPLGCDFGGTLELKKK